MHDLNQDDHSQALSQPKNLHDLNQDDHSQALSQPKSLHDLNQDDHSHALSHAHMLAHFSTKYSLNFFLKQWFGDAEKLTKALFSFASRLAPVIIFVDEVRLLK